MSLAFSQIQSSDLSRNPLKVFTAAESGPVLVTRRDGENFLIMTESEGESRQTLLKFAGRFYAVACDESDAPMTKKMVRQFPWMGALDEEELQSCVETLSTAALAAFETGQSLMFEITYNSMYDSAVAIAAGLHLTDREWTEQPIPAERP